MIQLPQNVILTNRSQGFLRQWQKAIDDEPDYESQIKKAKKSWGKSNKTFDEIKSKLRQMSNSTRRCNYCEDSYADEIEHIYPKDIYPERTFIWENYLYACGPCNGPKNNKFALIDGTVKLNDITPPRPIPDGHVFIRPPLDRIALVDPRIDDPLYFLELDLIQTFRFIPSMDIDAIDSLRAKYTIEVLRLNDREYLVNARKHAYENFRARLREYITQRDQGATRDELSNLINGIRDLNHQTVWYEMKRFRDLIPELTDLFDNAPEALEW